MTSGPSLVPLIVMVTSSEELAPNSSVMKTVKVRSTDSPELMKSRSSAVASNDQLTEPGAVTSVPETVSYTHLTLPTNREV